jgi:hypothetical protein
MPRRWYGAPHIHQSCVVQGEGYRAFCATCRALAPAVLLGPGGLSSSLAMIVSPGPSARASRLPRPTGDRGSTSQLVGHLVHTLAFAAGFQAGTPESRCMRTLRVIQKVKNAGARRAVLSSNVPPCGPRCFEPNYPLRLPQGCLGVDLGYVFSPSL